MNTSVKFEYPNGVAQVDIKEWILNRSISDTKELIRNFLKICNNKYEVCPIILEICKAFREGDIKDRPHGFSSNKAVAQKFWRRIEILEDAVKKYE